MPTNRMNNIEAKFLALSACWTPHVLKLQIFVPLLAQFSSHSNIFLVESFEWLNSSFLHMIFDISSLALWPEHTNTHNFLRHANKNNDNIYTNNNMEFKQKKLNARNKRRMMQSRKHWKTQHGNIHDIRIKNAKQRECVFLLIWDLSIFGSCKLDSCCHILISSDSFSSPFSLSPSLCVWNFQKEDEKKKKQWCQANRMFIKRSIRGSSTGFQPYTVIFAYPRINIKFVGLINFSFFLHNIDFATFNELKFEYRIPNTNRIILQPINKIYSSRRD